MSQLCKISLVIEAWACWFFFLRIAVDRRVMVRLNFFEEPVLIIYPPFWHSFIKHVLSPVKCRYQCKKVGKSIYARPQGDGDLSPGKQYY